MSVTPPLAPSSVAPSPVAPSNEAQPNPNALSDHNIFDYAVALEQSAVGGGGRLANPAALVGEVVENLRGFFKRARRMSKSIDRTEAASQGGLSAADTWGRSELASTLHPGPAQARLDPIGSGFGNSAVEETDDGPELTRQLTDELFNTALVEIQASLIATGSGRLSNSVNTLLRGQ
jgi:hypothetical protein